MAARRPRYLARAPTLGQRLAAACLRRSCCRRPSIPAGLRRLCFRQPLRRTSGFGSTAPPQPCSGSAGRFPTTPMAFSTAESCWRCATSVVSDSVGAIFSVGTLPAWGGVELVGPSLQQQSRGCSPRRHLTLLQAGSQTSEGLYAPRVWVSARPARRTEIFVQFRRGRSIFELGSNVLILTGWPPRGDLRSVSLMAAPSFGAFRHRAGT